MNIRHTLHDMGEKITGRQHPAKIYGEVADTRAEHTVFFTEERARWRRDVVQHIVDSPILSLRSLVGAEVPEGIQLELDAFDKADPDFQVPSSEAGDFAVYSLHDYLGDVR